MSVAAVVTTTIATTSLCPECGVTRKSGVMSCCAKGGSWFGKCGGADDTSVDHTWYEGVQVCKARQSQIAVGQQLRASQPRSNKTSSDFNMGKNIEMVNVGRHKRVPGTDGKSILVPISPPYGVTNREFITLDSKSYPYRKRIKMVRTTTTRKAVLKHATKLINDQQDNQRDMIKIINSASNDGLSTVYSHTSAGAPITMQHCDQPWIIALISAVLILSLIHI